MLHIKLIAPQTSSSWVRREGLLAWLDAATNSRLTLISAPPGFGKTSLVSQWTALHKVAHVAWLSLDVADNDPTRFWRYVITACQYFDERGDSSIGNETLAALRAPAQPGGPIDPATLLTPFLNDLARLSGKYVLVIEDYQVITATAIHESLAFWLDHVPPALHGVILTRSDPPLPLSRWRARDQLRELRAGGLRFTYNEIEAFVRSLVGATLNSSMLAQLDARLEGWPAGWRMWALLAASHQNGTAMDSFVHSFDGQHQHVVEFFTAEVLSTLAAPLRQFLLCTAFLSRLNGDLCDSITGLTDSTAVLAQLERDNLFVQRLGPDLPNTGLIWYRYHTLFAEALRHLARQHLSDDVLNTLQTRAGIWFAAHEQWPEAIEAMLAAQNTRQAAEYIERYLDRLQQIPLPSVRPWLEALTPADLEAFPTLYLALAGAILYTSDRRAATTHARLLPLLEHAEAYWRGYRAQHPNPDPLKLDTADERLGELLAFRASMEFWQGNFKMTLHWARAALELLPAHNAEWRGMCQLDVALDEVRQGRLADVLDTLIEARALCSASGNEYLAMAAVLVLGQVSVLRGELHQARQFYQHVLDVTAAQTAAEHMGSDRQLARIGLSRIAFDEGDLRLAQSYIAEAVAAGPQFGEESNWNEAVIVQAALQHAQGLSAQAQHLLHEASAQSSDPVISRLMQLTLAQLALADGDWAAAQRALASLTQLGPDSHLEEEMVALVQTQLLLAQGQSGEAMRQINLWRKEAEAQARNRRVIEWALLEARVHMLRDDDARARLALATAINLSHPEGILRPWVELGARLIPLLRTMAVQAEIESERTFLQRALTLLGEKDVDEGAIPANTTRLLQEPLSVQERRVLRLMAAGMTNTDIARELTVSVNTVKSQTQSIYRKLNVNSRDAAGDAARRLKLI